MTGPAAATTSASAVTPAPPALRGAIGSLPYRLQMAREKAGAETINYEQIDVIDALKEMTGGRGPDACIDAVGMEAHGHGPMYAYDRAMHAARLEQEQEVDGA